MKIEVSSVTKKYDDETVLDQIDIHLKDVEAVALLGKSGSGKSTLIRLMSGMETYESGTIKINEEDVLTRAFKDKIGFVFQTGSLFPHLTLKNNILLILEKIKKMNSSLAQERVDDLLQRFSLYEHRDKYPYMLSGGQQQRASIVRSLAVDAQIFFFDEPTSALDPILTNEVLEMIRELRNLGKSFFIVTHEIGFAKQAADYVLFLENGKIIEKGTVEILENPKTEEFKDFLKQVLN